MSGHFVEKKDNKASNDPKVGEAAMLQAKTGAEAQKFSQDYYAKYVAPMIEEMTSSSRKTQSRLDDLFKVNMDQMQKATARYEKYGAPAEDRYFKMVDDYSAPEEQERQAGLALGDVRSSMASQREQMGRRMAGLGIDPTSPAAISSMADMAIAGGAMEASAKNRARGAAKALGMQLTQDSANFGRGGQSAVLNFGGAASGNATGGFGVAAGAAGGVNAGAAVPMQGYGMQMTAANNNLSAYTSLAQTDAQMQQQNQAGMGQLLGLAGSLAFSDRRLKRDVVHIGTKDGLKVYSFRYDESLRSRYGDARYIGYMADEIEHVVPEAVSRDERGYMLLDYTKLPSLGA